MKRFLPGSNGSWLARWSALTLMHVCLTVSAQRLGLGPASRDIEQGAEAARLVAKQMGVSAAPKTEEFVRALGDRLVGVVNDPRWKFSFQIVDQAEPNAFAIPGGGVYVSRGLLTLVNSEAELAGVLAHEIAHVTERHSARQERKGFLPGLLSLPGEVVGNVVSENLGALIGAPLDSVGSAWMSRYSRGQETEADRIGIRTAAAAGYDPTALGAILVRLEKDVASLTGQQRNFSIFDSHPMTESRRKDIQRQAAALPPTSRPALTSGAEDLLARFDGLWWGVNPEAGVFRKNEFLHPVAGFTLTFPNGWKHQNTPEMVISVHPKAEAALLLGLAGPAADPELAGTRFIEKMRSKARSEPESTRRTSIGDFPAFVVTYLDRSRRTPVYLHFGWVTMAGQMFQIVGLGPESHRETLRTAAFTLRPLTAAERTGVKGQRLRVVQARAGESLAALSARTGNGWPLDYLALVNGLETTAALREGQWLKIAREESVGLKENP